MKQSEQNGQLMDELRAAIKKGPAGMGSLLRIFKQHDRDGSGSLDLAEFAKCIAALKLGLEPSRVARIFGAFDPSGYGTISYDEFLGALGAKLSAPRKASVLAVFHALDAMCGGSGELPVEFLQGQYHAGGHPAVTCGKAGKSEVLSSFVDGFIAPVIRQSDWLRYYEDVSSRIDSDDYFSMMVAGTWGHLKSSEGRPAVVHVAARDVDLLEGILFDTTYRKKGGSHHAQERLLVEAFKQFDVNGNSTVDRHEFLRAMERFGLPVRGQGRAGIGGLPEAVVFALFDRYDADASGSLSFREFASAFLRRHQTTSEPLPCEEYKAPTARDLERAGASAEELESKLRHPRQKSDHELMAARPMARASGGYLSAAAQVHGTSKASKNMSGAPFR